MKTFKLITLMSLILILGLTSCLPSEEERTNNAVKWLNTHEKPIFVTKRAINTIGDYKYTFIDAEGTVFYAGIFEAIFPDTIISYKQSQVLNCVKCCDSTNLK